MSATLFTFRFCQTLWALLILLWIVMCFVEAPPAWVIAMWVPLFVVGAFIFGFGEATYGRK